jgi:hypothetical protein
MQEPNPGQLLTILCQLLALLLALGVTAPSVLRAEDWDQINGRDNRARASRWRTRRTRRGDAKIPEEANRT